MQNDAHTLISVIVPICNVEKFLDQCLDSIQGQTYHKLEIICLNDGSRDGSLAIMQKHAEGDNRIIVVDKENEGYGATCNRGLDMATGGFVSIIEPDDYLLPTMYEDMLTFAASFEEPIDVIKTPWTDIANWNDPEKETKSPSSLYRRLTTSKKPFRLQDAPVLIEAHPSIWSALYRKAFLDQKNIRFIPYPGAGWADNPFLIESLAQADSIVYLDKPYYNYRTDLTGSTHHHKTDAAIVMPFDRWIEMSAILKRLSITNLGVLQKHYLRGFNYVAGAIRDDGWDNTLVQQKTRELFSTMDKDIVVNHPDLHPQRKLFYFEQTNQQPEKLSAWPHRKHLIKEAVHTIRARGFAYAVSKATKHSASDDPIRVDEGKY